MAAPPPSQFKTSEIALDKEQIKLDLINKYREILKIHLEGRTFKVDKIKSWLNNILIDAKEYFIQKYQNYDLFLFTQMRPQTLVYRSNSSGILYNITDSYYFVDYENADFYCVLSFFSLSVIILIII